MWTTLTILPQLIWETEVNIFLIYIEVREAGNPNFWHKL
jgi:hypothetical protein